MGCKFSGLKVWTASLGAIVVAIAMTMGPAADAQQTQKKKKVTTNQVTTTQPRARIRVERRSFLDAGTEVLPGERKFTDYAFPPGYSVLGNALGPGQDFRRRPLLDPWDFPGMSKF
jgi:hypothetical protein